MKNKDLKVYTPFLAVLLLLVCILYSLLGYEPPVYTVDEMLPDSIPQNISPAPQKAPSPKKLSLIERPKDTASAVPAAAAKKITPVKESGNYKDGTYYGTSTGFGGKMKVKVVIKGGKITSIKVMDNQETPGYLARARQVIRRIRKKQSTNVDIVSGATYSSNGIILAVRSALKKASVKKDKTKSKKSKKKDESKKTPPSSNIPKGNFPYPDGTYQGTAEGYSSDITVAVTLKNGTITRIEVLSQDEDESFFRRALAILDQILNKQTTGVNAVSGATYSSNGLRDAVANALKEAKKAAEKPSGGETDDPGKPDTPDGPDGPETPDDPGNPNDPNPPDNPEEPVPTVYQAGSFSATAVCYPDEDWDFDYYNLSLTIQIQNDRIVDVSGITGDGGKGNDRYINLAKKGVVPQILAKGLPEGIDSVSGATCSSAAIVEACQAALERARN